MRKLGDALGRLWLWSNETDPRTWATHAVISLAMALPVAIWNPLVAALVPIIFYVPREVEQVVTKLAKHERLHPLDHVMDALGPVMVGAVIAWL